MNSAQDRRLAHQLRWKHCCIPPGWPCQAVAINTSLPWPIQPDHAAGAHHSTVARSLVARQDPSGHAHGQTADHQPYGDRAAARVSSYVTADWQSPNCGTYVGLHSV